MRGRLRVPCAYQGGKQRVAAQIVDRLLLAAPSEDARFYDLCCGSGAVSIELVNRGVHPSQITMLDISSWGVFWCAIASGTFNMDAFDALLTQLPDDKRALKAHVSALSRSGIGQHEAELFLILQACSFGGKQIWRKGDGWANACFRDYWEPTAISVRRSPANPMQPSPSELSRRTKALADGMQGVRCLNADVSTILDSPIHSNSVVYVDPPYEGSTGYGYNFDLRSFVRRFHEINSVPMFISEGVALDDNAFKLSFGGAKGGISGVKKGKHEEWLTCSRANPVVEHC